MNKVNRILTVFLSGYMLLAMGGLNIYYHLCSCTNSITTSVIIEESCCDNTLHHDDCCENHQSKSCHSEREKDCDCNTNVVTFQVDNASFSPQTFRLTEADTLLAVIAFFDYNSLIFNKNENSVSLVSYAAPPISGKELVISLQRIKIPDHIS